jgi:hypothetical protein
MVKLYNTIGSVCLLDKNKNVSYLQNKPCILLQSMFRNNTLIFISNQTLYGSVWYNIFEYFNMHIYSIKYCNDGSGVICVYQYPFNSNGDAINVTGRISRSSGPTIESNCLL